MKKYLPAVGVVGAILLGYAAGAAETAKPARPSSTYDNLHLFVDVLERVKGAYVEDPDDSKMIEASISGMLESLDPHSSYMAPEEFTQFNSVMSGEYSGLGLEVQMEDGLVKVVSPIDDSPAFKAGILAGDYISKIDGGEVQGLSLDQAVAKMRGPADSKIKLEVLRKGLTKPMDIELTRKTITVESVRHRVERTDIGYIRITQFTQRTGSGMETAFAEIDKKTGGKVKGYILDLRNNPGGSLEQAVTVSDDFLDRGEVVSMRARRKEEDQRWNATAGDLAKGKPVIVLINSGSASASEIVAGALQDQERATLVGVRSFGKGSVQTVVPLANGGALRLTTAKYYTPSGRSIQAAGIVPDIKVEQPLPAGLEGFQPRREEDIAGHIENPNGKVADPKAADKAPAVVVPAVPVAPAAPAAPATAAATTPEDVQLNYALDLLTGKKPWPKKDAAAKVAAVTPAKK